MRTGIALLAAILLMFGISTGFSRFAGADTPS